jgi:hypothetical protein
LEVDVVIVMLTAIAVLLTVPAVAVVLVSVASRREASAGTLSGPAPTWLQAGTRRVLGFYSQGIEWQPLAGSGRTRHRLPGPAAQAPPGAGS